MTVVYRLIIEICIVDFTSLPLTYHSYALQNVDNSEDSSHIRKY